MSQNTNSSRAGGVGRWVARFVAVLLLVTPRMGAQSYTIMPSPFQTALDNSGNIISNACIWTYSAGTTTPIATYSDTAGTPNLNPIRSDAYGRFTAYLLSGTGYKFTYENSNCVPPSTHGTVLRTADNISGSPASSANVDVTGTAGETITAGQCVYLSDGSGSKAAGQWFKCDPTNSYASATPLVGIATSNIVTATTGTLRLSGLVTGLSVTTGTDYYAGTAGALTSSAPTMSRRLGRANSATSLILETNPAVQVIPSPILSPLFTGCGVRLTLTTGTAVTTGDVTAATSVYVTPYAGGGFGAGVCGFYDGTASWQTIGVAEVAVALGTLTASLPYDVFCYNNAGAMGCDAPVAWSSGTARVTALVLQNGVLVKTGATTRRYMGTFYTTTTTATEDSFANRYVFSYYGRVPRPMKAYEATATWAYATATLREARAQTTNQLNFVIGVSESPVTAMLAQGVITSAGGTASGTIGLDSTTAAAADATIAGTNAPTIGTITTSYTGFPGVGVHYLSWLEKGDATSTTWVSTSGSLRSGLQGVVLQ